jgi:uncharacterized protein
MQTLLLIGVVGFVAQLVDGALGMGYGTTSATLLLATGLTPAAASASVHLAEVGTTFVSGLSHWKFGNVDWRSVVLLAAPGGIGGFTGAVLLSNVSADAARPWVSAFLFALGVYILVRFAMGRAKAPPSGRRFRARFLGPLGLGAGFLDAAGGGGWGAITTSTLVASNRMEPRRVLGTVSASEFVVSLGASVGFLLALSQQGIGWTTVASLLAGGVVAAPIAAYVVRIADARILGAAVGGMILFTNADRILAIIGLSADVAAASRAGIIVVSIIALAIAARRIRRERQRPAELASADTAVDVTMGAVGRAATVAVAMPAAHGAPSVVTDVSDATRRPAPG